LYLPGNKRAGTFVAGSQHTLVPTRDRARMMQCAILRGINEEAIFPEEFAGSAPIS
jgi:hypothetical protein